MKNLSLLMCTAFCGLHTAQADAADNKKNERPNILWLTFEDTSAYEFGCYGNKDVHTPNADSLAARSILFLFVWFLFLFFGLFFVFLYPQCRQSGCPRHTIHERKVGGPAKFGRTLIAHYGLLLLDLRNGCPSGSIRHPGKHLLPAMAA